MNLPLLFGILIYLFILISLTVWLTKYHQYQDRGMDLPHQTRPTGEEKSLIDPANLQPNESEVPTSGDNCSIQDGQGGAKE